MPTTVEFAPRELPTVPTDLQVYNSYVIDPQWQIKFTIIWTSVLAFSTLVSIPYVLRAARSGRLYAGLAIIETDEPIYDEKGRAPVPAQKVARRTSGARAAGRAAYALWQTASLWTPPMPTVRGWKAQVGDCCRRSYCSLGVAQMGLVGAYLAACVACFVVGAQLSQNGNRAGFLALANLPVILLLSLKSPLPLPVFLPTMSYEHYNFLHRWAGRTMWLASTVHGALWLHQFIALDEYDQVWADKTKRGMLSYGLLCMVVLTSLKPVRRYCYQLFWIAHVMFFTGFFAAISYHTPYSRPWIYPCVAIYAYDHFVRLLRYRIKPAVLVPVDPTLTMVHIPTCDAGWLPTQHVFLRVFAGPGIFESHPFTITNAPPSSAGAPRGIILYAKVAGDWTRRLHALARAGAGLVATDFDWTIDGACEGERYEMADRERLIKGDAKDGLDHPGARVTVMLDGPYGGLTMDLGDYESVLLVAGGSGVTYALGAIEEAVRCRERGRGPSSVNVAWVVRDLSTIEALAPTLAHLHDQAARLGMALTYALYLSRPPTPLPVLSPALPASTTLNPFRPSVAQLVREALPVEPGHVSLEAGDATPPSAAASASTTMTTRGGLAVVAAGPEGLVMEARNAVAEMSVASRVRAGGVGFHAESYAL
ncbi:hypothetical protein Q5752_003495 [Cryptotrichosporon argae]